MTSRQVFGILLVSVSVAAADVKNFESKGNLESKHTVNCSQKLSSKYSPSDLFKAVAKCVAGEKYEDAVLPYILALTYGAFDRARVADQTAHQAIAALTMQEMGGLEEAKIAKFDAEVKKTIEGKKMRAKICQKINRIGRPQYFPTYMIQHGMDSFIAPEAKALVKNFKAKKAWKDALESVAKCHSKS